MPDIGFLELMLVGVIAFLLLGPERMPELFAQMGRVVRKGRSWYADIREKIETETAPLKNPLHDVKDAVGDSIEDYNAAIMKELGHSMPGGIASAGSEVHTSADTMQDEQAPVAGEPESVDSAQTESAQTVPAEGKTSVKTPGDS